MVVLSHFYSVSCSFLPTIVYFCSYLLTKTLIQMSEFIIHNVLFDVTNRMCDFNGDEEQEKPVYEYPNHYLGKIIGKRGQEPSPAQVGGNARCGAAAERVKNPVALVGRGKDHPDEQAQGLLGGVLAAGLLPTAYGWHAPHVGHLLAFVQLLHQARHQRCIPGQQVQQPLQVG